jgi:hypothetical protein
MEKQTVGPRKSSKPSWLIGAIILICAALAMCLVFLVTAVLYLRPLWGQPEAAPETPAAATEPAESLPATKPPLVQGSAALDYKAEPLHGSADLQRAFTPDPYVADVEAGGSLDASDLDLNCGFVTAQPTFRFSLKGGASETFLRIYFVPAGDMDSTLIVHSPDGQWLCEDDPTDGGGMDPVVDFEFAPSGQYAVWAGTIYEGTQAGGRLYITQSQDNHP